MYHSDGLSVEAPDEFHVRNALMVAQSLIFLRTETRSNTDDFAPWIENASSGKRRLFGRVNLSRLGFGRPSRGSFPTRGDRRDTRQSDRSTGAC
jgi:hypothetical protein